jgi:hypothetical protein
MNYCAKLKKAIFFITSILVISSIAIAEDYYKSQGWEVIKSDQNSLILLYKPVLTKVDTIITKKGIRTIYPIIEGAYSRGEAGSPLKLIASINVTVPNPKGFDMSYEVRSYNFYNGILSPNPQYVKKGNLHDLKYIIDNSKYDNHKENEIVTLNYSGIARNRHIAALKINLTDYFSNKIKIPNEIIITVNFKSNNTIKKNKNISADDYPVSINNSQTKDWIINYPQKKEKKNAKATIQGTNDQIWLKLKIDKEGLYKITASKLSEMGYSISKEEIETIKIYGNGGFELSELVDDGINNKLNEQTIIVETNSSGNLDKIIFYGSPANGFKYDPNKGFYHYINHYSNYNYYLITWKGSEGKRAIAKQTPTGDVVNRPTTYTNMLYYEEELENAYLGGSGRTWFGRNYLPVTFTSQLNNLDRSGEILYRVSFAHRAPSTGQFIVKENNNEIIKSSLNGIGGYYDAYRTEKTATVNASIIAGDNRSSLQFDYSNLSPDATALGYFDWFEIQYPAYLLPLENQIVFFTDPSSTGLTEYSINNFTNSPIYGFEVTDPANPEMIENISNIGGLFAFRNNDTLNRPQRFFISSNFKSPITIEKVEFADLRNKHANADMIVITHPNLVESAEKYKEYREKQSNIKVEVVKTSDIFIEFASCIPDPTGIRDFLAYAYQNWDNKPRWVLLWGDGHYDYKQIRTQEINYVPTFQTEDNVNSFYEIESYTSDDYFACIHGDDDVLDISLGRLPVYSNETGNWIVAKIDSFENKSSVDSWRSKMTIVADDSWKSTGYDQSLHTSQAESLWVEIIPEDIQVKKIYLPEYPTVNVTGGRRKPKVMEEIISTVNTGGNLLISFIGHGNPRVWTHEEVFERSISIPQMKNLNKLFFLTAASCDFGRFDDPETRSGAEELILSTLGGSIGTFASSRLVYSEPNHRLNKEFYSNIFARKPENGMHYTIGEVNLITKISHRDDTNSKKYCMLADPALKLLLPDYNTVIEKINDIDVRKGDTANIKALSKVKIEGMISNPSSTITDESFNGTVIITMLDCDKQIEIHEQDGSSAGTIHRYTKNGGALNRSSYPVINGKFTAEFYIPKDISFAGKPGRLYAYAYSEDNRFSNGDTRNFIIDGIDITDIKDNIGPEINIFLDSRDFISGDYVKCKPLLIVDLSDESGINTTGLGLGHRIEAWIDNSPTSLDLTEKFRSSLDNSNSGTAEDYISNLDPGIHTVKVRAWDIFNNFSVAETVFRTSDCDGIIISNLMNYPNPAGDNTIIKFNHNISPPFTAELKIVNILGQEVNKINEQITSDHSASIEWDLKDKNGRLVSQGNYYYILNLETNSGIKVNEQNILTIIR